VNPPRTGHEDAPRPGIGRPILWAHRGASALARENTIRAFELAIRLGATGLESDVHLSLDGWPVLVHDPRIRRAGWWRIIARHTAAELRHWQVPSLDDLYAAVGIELPLSLDLNDVRTSMVADAVVASARRAGGTEALERLHLCLGDIQELERQANREPDATWVHSGSPRSLTGGFTEHARRLADAGIDVLNLKWPSWGSGRRRAEAVSSVQAAGIRAFAWDTQRARAAEEMLAAGVDGVYADDPRQLITAVERVAREHRHEPAGRRLLADGRPVALPPAERR
jgi:glycerophosphoryl diester phosphodiesterase